VPFLRPKKLAQDTTSSQDTILHAIDWYNKNGYHPETVVLLQPTSPFREVNHIKEVLKTFSSNIDMVVSVKETESNPYFVLFEENKNGYLRKTKDSAFTRKQDCPKVWEYNGSIYVMNVASLRKNKIEKFTKIKKFIMDDPVLSVDIDTEIDWIMAESILLTRKF
jgi:CMP-N,N'-diacetyllegionaminic acid synthase